MKVKNNLLMFLMMFLLLVAFSGVSETRVEVEEKNVSIIDTMKEKNGTFNDNKIVLNEKGIIKKDEIANKLNAKIRVSFDGKYATLTLKDNETINDVCNNYPEYIDCFELDYYVYTSEETEVEETIPTKEPNYNVTDEFYDRQTYIDYINVGDCWNKTKGEEITVAVIDTGIDTDHPEFIGKISDLSYNATTDEVGIEYVEDVQGHGTSVAGVIAASMNDTGITGIAPNVNLLIIKCEANEDGEFLSTSDLVFGLYYAIEKDVDIINMSFGTYENPNPFKYPLELAVDSDIICVASAGNDATSALSYPASDSNCIGVGALASDSWELAEYSNYGDNVTLVAPGTTYTTKMGGLYDYATGTSFSSPIVAGGLALYLSLNRYSEYTDVCEMIYASSMDLGALGQDWYYGFGALDLNALICEERGTLTYDYLSQFFIPSTKTQNFIKNQTIQYVDEPEREDAIFDGWYYDIECLEEYNYYEDTFTEDLTLYCKWSNEDEGIPYTYVTLEDNTIEIRSYTGKRRYVVVPEMIEGKIVSSIGDNCFASNSKIVEVVLPETINNIGAYAFFNCYRLVKINIPVNVKDIRDYCFGNCSRLQTIEIPSDSLLERIGDYAFCHTNLVRVDITKKVERINGTCFYGCPGIRQITIAKENTSYKLIANAVYDYAGELLVYYPSGISGEYHITEGTKQIGLYAFNCSRIIGVVFPDSLLEIDSQAFTSSRLRTVNIPNTITNLSDGVFSNCLKLKTVTFDDNMKVNIIPNYTFGLCVELENIVLPNNIVSIGSDAFNYCTSLKSITIPNKVEIIDSCAFSYCFSLQNIIFETKSSLKAVGEKAFYTTSISSINLPDSLIEIGSFALCNTLIEEITIPSNVILIGEGAFITGLLTNIIVNSNNPFYKAIDGVLYSYDEALIHTYPNLRNGTNYIISNLTTEIGKYAFSNCIYLENITLPDSLTTINSYSFSSCISLKTIEIPNSVESIRDFIVYNTPNLETITFEDNTSLTRLYTRAFEQSGIRYITIPSEINSMGQYVFSGCNNLQTITFEDNSMLTSIAGYTFSGASNLKTISFGSNNHLTSIQAYGLYNMISLESINIENCPNLKIIDNYSFQWCTKLNHLELPDNVEEIGRYAFYGTSLSSITLPKGIKRIGRYAFFGTNNLNVYFTSSVLPNDLQDDWDKGIQGYYVGVNEIINGDTFDYALLDNGSISLIKYKGNNETLILNKIDNKDIISIGAYCFSNNKTLKSVTLPSTLTGIYTGAFSGCTMLNSIEIPESVSIISEKAFYNSGIESVTINTNQLKSINRYTFSNTKLTSIVIPNSIEEIKDSAFEGSTLSTITFNNESNLIKIGRNSFNNTKLTNVILPNQLELIDYYAFSNIKTLKTITFNQTKALRINGGAFENSGLESITIPSNVYYIGEFAFTNNSSLLSINVTNDNQHYTSVDGVVYSKDKSKLMCYPAGKTGEFTIPLTVTSIGFGAFERTKLSKINIPNELNILTIGNRTFLGATNLTTIQIPDSVQSIGYYAFAYCNNLQSILVNENTQINGIYDGAFYDCDKLESINIPSTIYEIGDNTFNECNNLIEIIIPEDSNLVSIGKYSFANTKITEINLGDKLLSIDEYAFQNTKLKELEMPITVGFIGFNILNGVNTIEKLRITYLYNSLGYLFGASNYKQNTDYVPNSLKHIEVTNALEVPYGYFRSCFDIETITLNEGLTSIGGFAFGYCEKLEMIIIPETVYEIGESAFSPSVTDLNTAKVFRGSISNIVFEVSYWGLQLGIYYENIVSINENDDYQYAIDKEGKAHIMKYLGNASNPDIVIDGYEIVEIGGRAFYQNTNVTNITIPDTVKKINDYAFSMCSSLKNILISNNLQYIGESVFSSCKSLNSIQIPDSVQYVGERAFIECKSLTSVVLSKNLKRINSFTFFSCDNLTDIILPEGILEIGEQAFFMCCSLSKIIIPKDILSIGNLVFFECSSLTIFFKGSNLPSTLGSEWNGNNPYYLNIVNIANNGEYEYAINNNNDIVILDYKGSDTNISIEIDNYNIIGLGSKVFENNSLIESVIMPNTIESISGYVFNGCTNLKSVTLSNSLVSIGEYSFSDCIHLESIIIPNSVTSIKKYAFSNCKKLNNITLPNNLENIGDHVFKNCVSLTNILLPDTIKSIKMGCFMNCINLQDIVIPNSVERIEYNAFDGCTKMETILIPDSLNYIFGDAFNDCYSLNIFFSSDKLPDRDEAPYWTVWNPENRPYYLNIKSFEKNDEYEYALCNDNSVIILKYLGTSSNVDINIDDYIVTQIGSKAFYNCDFIEAISIPDSIVKIYKEAFSGCKALEYIDIPDSTRMISDYTFKDCTSLVGIVIPEKVYIVGNNIFEGCSSTIVVKTPNVLIEYYWDKEWNKEEMIHIIYNNEEYIQEEYTDGLQFTLDYENFIYTVSGYTGESAEVIIPSEYYGLPVRNIGRQSFDWNLTLLSVVMPDSIETIGNSAFLNCISLRYVKLSNNLRSLEKSIFWSCENLTSIFIPESVQSIGDDAFYRAPTTLFFEGCSLPINIGNNPIYDGNHFFNSTYYGEYDGIYYAIKDDELIVAGVDSDYEYVYIPDEINGYKVISGVNKLLFPCEKVKILRIPFGGNMWSYFDSQPFSLKKVVIDLDAKNTNYPDFSLIQNIDIYFEKEESEISLPDDWNFGNKVYYSNEWNYVYYYDENHLLSFDIILLSAVLQVPDYSLIINKETNTKEVTFVGWDINNDGVKDEMPSILTSDLVCKTVKEINRLQYEVVFKNDDGKIISKHLYDLNSIINAPNISPVKLSNELYDYKFTNWTGYTEGMVVTEDMEFIANYMRSNKLYKYMFIGKDGKILSETEVIKGTIIKAPNTDSIIENTYTYDFKKWNTKIPKTISDDTYIFALYNKSFTNYVVNFIDYDNKVISTNTYHYGDKVEIPTNPNRINDNTYTYVFKSWDKEVTNCTEDATYKAIYDCVYINYTVKFMNEDNIVLEKNDYHYGEKIVLPSNPTKKSDNIYTYTFKEWKNYTPNMTVTNDIVFTALYTERYIEYVVKFFNYDNKIISSNTYHYGDKIIVPSSVYRANDDTYTYVFKSWDKEVTNCTSDVIYKAVYDSVYINYSVKFMNEDNLVLEKNDYHYGEKIVLPSNPTRENDNTYTYTFKEWKNYTPNMTVTNDIVFTAVYDSYPILSKDDVIKLLNDIQDINLDSYEKLVDVYKRINDFKDIYSSEYEKVMKLVEKYNELVYSIHEDNEESISIEEKIFTLVNNMIMLNKQRVALIRRKEESYNEENY